MSSTVFHRDLHSFPTRRSSDLPGLSTLVRAGDLLRLGDQDLGLADRRKVDQPAIERHCAAAFLLRDRKSTRLNSSHLVISYAVFCLKKKKRIETMKETSEHPRT